eukprot:2395904-Rhodomonas_salina.1
MQSRDRHVTRRKLAPLPRAAADSLSPPYPLALAGPLHELSALFEVVFDFEIRPASSPCLGLLLLWCYAHSPGLSGWEPLNSHAALRSGWKRGRDTLAGWLRCSSEHGRGLPGGSRVRHVTGHVPTKCARCYEAGGITCCHVASKQDGHVSSKTGEGNLKQADRPVGPGPGRRTAGQLAGDLPDRPGTPVT